MYRDGSMPLLGKEAIRSFLSWEAGWFTCEPIKSDVAGSGDLGYTYGKYEIKGDASGKGYYVRVWKRVQAGKWKVVLDVTTAIPAKSSQ